MRTTSGQLIGGLMNDGTDDSDKNKDSVWDPSKPLVLNTPPPNPDGSPGPGDVWSATSTGAGVDSPTSPTSSAAPTTATAAAPTSNSAPKTPDDLDPGTRDDYDAWSKQNPGVSFADSPWGNPNAPGGLGNGNTGNDGLTAGPATSIGPQGGPTTPIGGTKDYSALAAYGFDPKRANDPKDIDGKYKFGRWLVDNGYIGGDKKYDANAVRAFVAANPDEWEIMNPNSDDPLIRQKQSWLDDPKNGDGKSGQRSTWQDVIGDSGPGGANKIQFGNADGDPAQGFAGFGGNAAGGSGGTGAPGSFSGMNTNVSDDLKSLLMKYYGSASPMRTIFGSNLSGNEGQ